MTIRIREHLTLPGQWTMVAPVICLIIGLFAGFSYASGVAPLQLGADDSYPLTPHLMYLEDTTGRLTIDIVKQPGKAVLFRPVKGPAVNFGYSHSVFWLSVVVRGDPRAVERCFLEIAYPPLDRATVFLLKTDGSLSIAEAGDRQPFALRPYPHRNLVFPLTFPAGGESRLLIRVESDGSLTVPATLWKEEAFYRESHNGYVIHSLYFGILGALFFYNLMLFLSIRERVYLAYICFVAAMAVGQVSQSGLGNEYLWPGLPEWGNVAYPCGFSATGLFGALFTRLFLDTRRSAPRLDRLIVFLSAGFAFSTVSPLFISYQATAILTSLLGVSFSATAVAAGVVCLVNKHPGARYFLVAWSLLLMGVAMLGMRNMAWLPTTMVTTYGMQIGSALEMLLLSFALADRINQARREKEAAQQGALSISLEAERELAAKAREWEETFNSISDMVVILDREHNIIKSNKAVVDFFKTVKGEPQDLKCYDFYHDSRRPIPQCPCAETFKTKQAAVVEYFEPDLDRFLEVSTSPILGNAGDVIAVVHITKDITWRKKMEEEIMRTQKLESLGVMAGGIAHDFNNMLTIIMSTTTLAKMYAKDDPKAVAKLDEAGREIMHARELTNQLLTFAKGGAPVKKLSSFRELLSDTVEFSLTGSSNVECETIVPDDLWSAEIDRTQIAQVISNLVINSKQAMPLGGTIRVDAGNVIVDKYTGLPLEDGRYVRISVEDNGSGIPQEDQPKIFDPFFTTKVAGSGLGLSSSYSIIKKHNGYIDVKSRLGEGCVFDVYLPASTELHVKENVGTGRLELRGAGRVLLMDDDENLLKNVNEMLTTLGYEVETARNGQEAVILYKRAKALSRPFHAVVLDLTIARGIGGRECMEQLLLLDPCVNALVMSGYAEDATLAEYGRYGFREALSKPFTIEELHAALQKVMSFGEQTDE